MREFMARFDVPWHRERAQAFERQAQWYAAAFHWGQLAEHGPHDEGAWQQLETACTHLGNWEIAFRSCNRLLERDPTQAPAYFRRARLRAHLFQFHEATADNLAGLALLRRAKAP